MPACYNYLLVYPRHRFTHPTPSHHTPGHPPPQVPREECYQAAKNVCLTYAEDYATVRGLAVVCMCVVRCFLGCPRVSRTGVARARGYNRNARDSAAVRTEARAPARTFAVHLPQACLCSPTGTVHAACNVRSVQRASTHPRLRCPPPATAHPHVVAR